VTAGPTTVVVTPIYEDREASTRLFEELANQNLDNLRVVAVDDGSVKEPLAVSSIEQSGLQGVVLRLKRNVGHQRAIAIGLSYVSENLSDVKQVIVMDSDGEDLPSTIRTLLEELASDSVDVVVAERKSRVESFRFRAFYEVYKLLFRLLVGRNISFGNFMAIKSGALSRLIVMPELWIHVASCMLTSKLRIATCLLDRGPRYAGHSKMNFVGLALHGFRGLMVFAEDVLIRVGIACGLVAFFAILAATMAIVLKIIGFATPGWFSVALGILFMVFLQTGTLTLMTLMLTGVVRNTSVSPPDYKEFVKEVFPTSSSGI
jgi:glycosyltransferase involved in cell wall biosynthesis